MTTAKDIMSTSPICVAPDHSIKDTARLFLEKDISGAPVLDASGKLVGIITKKDIIDTIKELKLPRMINLFDAIIYLENTEEYNHELGKISAVQVAEAMTRKVVTVDPQTDIAKVAGILSESHVHMVPVVDEGNRVQGIVSTTDIMRAIAYDNGNKGDNQ
ncbi:CBS domain-containing protein [Desulfurispirillum indicum]|uniref:CBS domain containing protein n=1 Tax=Desulfurispirillum indicum (strain ATCC BAA-1389 / DSM 22839 / S5) TaxID=653733 RepID=E6W4L1_DESIS|nr:CBS domain-containing protein [Desulfurispirillum indicum]ADU67084.1 CBS domain containing protein [Desulfurispirillum indicum S5]UCZ56403.1 CBS domain-containing protein [Desulfurispirillum indicum]